MSKKLQGFATLSPERRKQIASMGGKAVDQKGTRHKFTSEQASAMAKESHKKKKAHQFNTAEAREAGRRGGINRAKNRREKLALQQTLELSTQIHAPADAKSIQQ